MLSPYSVLAVQAEALAKLVELRELSAEEAIERFNHYVAKHAVMSAGMAAALLNGAFGADICEPAREPADG